MASFMDMAESAVIVIEGIYWERAEEFKMRVKASDRCFAD
jgi:hypothetical protein